MPIGESFNDGSVFVFPDDYAQFNRSELVGEHGLTINGERLEDMELAGTLSDSDMVFRKAEESAKRRYLAALWIQQMVGPIELPAGPSEEEFGYCLRNGMVLCRLVNKIQPGSVPRIVQSCSLIPGEGALSAYQYFENVRNFLLAVEDLNIPTFDTSDLEETSFPTGSVARVVDCILGLKSYHEWKERGGTPGQWKHGVTVRQNGTYPKNMLTFSIEESGTLLNPTRINGRKRCILPDLDFMGDTQLLLSQVPMESPGSQCQKGQGRNTLPDCNSKQAISTMDNHDWQAGLSKSFDDIESQSPAWLSSTVRALLSQKQPDEIPMVVEFMLQKVMEDYRRRFFAQGLQLKKLRNALKEALNRGNDPQSNLDPEDGTANDGRIVSDQLKLIKDLREASHNTKQEVLAMRQNWKMELEYLESQLQGLVAAASGYQKVLSENRKLYNEVQDLKGSIRVYCRVRPLLTGNLERKTTVEFIGENGDIIISNPKRQGKDACRNFRFNKVFGTSASQEEVFLDTQPLIRSVLDGYNVCIFAYGQTGSGKTYTMSGPPGATEDLWGVNYRALNDLFHISQSRKGVCRYEIGVQMVEIYNEQVRDLLAGDGPSRKLEIRNNSQHNGLNVPDASMLNVTSTVDVLELMRAGQKNRAIGATAINERSSRSHSVLTIHVQGKDLVTGSILRGCLHLIDLAGSERVNKSEATGDRLKEAQHINKSLSALGDVISALSQKNGHVPYRNSKLTQLLQDSLGGQAKTLMFVHINPDVDSFGETMSTLKFAERVASIELGAARSNKETGELQELKEQIMILKDSLSKKDADLDKLLLLRNLRESGFSIEKQKRRQNLEEHEHKSRKQVSESVKVREGSPPVRDRGRRFSSPPGNMFGFAQGELDRASSPSKAEVVAEQQKRKGGKPKHASSPKSPYEDFAPKSPYRERHRPRNGQYKTKSPVGVFVVDSPPSQHLGSSGSQSVLSPRGGRVVNPPLVVNSPPCRVTNSPNRVANSPPPCRVANSPPPCRVANSPASRVVNSPSLRMVDSPSMVLVDSPPRLISPDVDGLINKEAELSRDSPVLCTPAYDPAEAISDAGLLYHDDQHSMRFPSEDSNMPVITASDLQIAVSSSELRDTGAGSDGGDNVVVAELQNNQNENYQVQNSERADGVLTTHEAAPLQRLKDPAIEDRGTRIQNRSPAHKPGPPRSRKGQSVSCVRRKSVVTSRTESPVIRRTSSSIPFSARHTTLECHGKQSFSRQLLSIETGISSRASKRWSC